MVIEKKKWEEVVDSFLLVSLYKNKKEKLIHPV